MFVVYRLYLDTIRCKHHFDRVYLCLWDCGLRQRRLEVFRATLLFEYGLYANNITYGKCILNQSIGCLTFYTNIAVIHYVYKKKREGEREKTEFLYQQKEKIVIGSKLGERIRWISKTSCIFISITSKSRGLSTMTHLCVIQNDYSWIKLLSSK